MESTKHLTSSQNSDENTFPGAITDPKEIPPPEVQVGSAISSALGIRGPPPTLLRRPEVEDRTGLKRSKIYELMTDGLFPAQVKLGPGSSVAWVESDINEWIQRQIDNGRNILTKKSSATENFLRTQLGNGAIAEPILRQRADSYGILWELIETALEDGLVTTETVNGMAAPRWSLA